MFARELSHAGHTRRFSIIEAGNEGWEVLVELDMLVVSRVHYTDWHRVERAIQKMTLQVADLLQRGWSETAHRAPA